MDRPIEKKKWTPQRIALIMAVAAFVAFTVHTLVGAGGGSSLNVERDKLTVSTVERGTFDEFIIVTGVVQPLKTYQLDAIEGGYVSKKFLDGGATVRSGDPILKLDNQQLTLDFMNRETEMHRLINELENTRLSLRQNKFTLRRTLADLDFQIAQARDEFDRNEKLAKTSLVSEQDFFKSKTTLERLTKQREIEVENQQFQEENANVQIRQPS